MKLSVIGGGAWGTTMAQVLRDNNHEVLIYEINESYVDAINNKHIHPIFNNTLDADIKATTDLKKAIEFSDTYILAVPTAAMRIVLKSMNEFINRPSRFINISKGIEPQTLKRVSEIVEDEIDHENNNGFVCLTGPSHAEEVIDRKLTLLTSASNNKNFAIEVQELVSNSTYIRTYTLDDLIGAEVGGAVKNAIAVISGAAAGYGLGENARAAIITRGILEILKVVEIMGGKKETVFGLTGIGDLIVTASSEQSRNFQGGRKIGMGMTKDEIYKNSTQTIEGFRTIYALNDLSKKYGVELPMINTAFDILENNISIKEGIKQLLSRDLKPETLE
ncbi:NAD(P)H-dependent glycerol-3-phosphate dehydrogenase [Haploplasma modicum]|uniref:NAD(P)H-dependent glycerol-3-phosphate dehydrogenase n=1 Tax=Haploplasma modicum TaxID=2150 RepID=UPI00068CFCD8|nr:NAD(P)H-dependent glycerol-3-phosphate dehydrogenase [Haploplasma modicum]